MDEKKEKRKQLLMYLYFIIFFEILKLFRFIQIPFLKNMGEFIFEHFKFSNLLICLFIEYFISKKKIMEN